MESCYGDIIGCGKNSTLQSSPCNTSSHQFNINNYAQENSYTFTDNMEEGNSDEEDAATNPCFHDLSQTNTSSCSQNILGLASHASDIPFSDLSPISKSSSTQNISGLFSLASPLTDDTNEPWPLSQIRKMAPDLMVIPDGDLKCTKKRMA
eukprot:scaffold161999_cov90-Attheya_sp.AAC.3